MVTQVSFQKNDNRWKVHKNLVSGTGYAAAAFGTVCGVTGLKSVNILCFINFPFNNS